MVFLTIRHFWEIHHLYRGSVNIDVFELLIKHLLANTVNDVTAQSFGEDWGALQWRSRPRRDAPKQIASREEKVRNFNIGLVSKLDELKAGASQILGKFGYDVSLDFRFQGITYDSENNSHDNNQIILTIEFFDRDIPSHHHFLNEARLSAIALSIYFAAFLLLPASDLKVLALDDVLIGLDMSNRLPVLEILEEYFSEYQIILTTYDKAWYEIVKQRTTEKEWKYAEFYCTKTNECEVPIYVENKGYLEKARQYLDDNDYKACVIYLRSAFEAAIKRYCDKKRLSVKYRQNPKQLKNDDFWVPIKTEENKNGILLLDLILVDKIERYLNILLNPLSHDTIVNTHRKELEDAIEAVDELQRKLRENSK